ncbi:D-alanyl-D-alanine carboxypeptidase family protein [Fructilactobacillus sp. Tb1]|uniref:D-alanyl-D-alanine carboxypeptidase family protein n=1 Tax=Fructilactobacillus sp. Tb1 TaxID=3422304 RepID=UPI003D2D71C1
MVSNKKMWLIFVSFLFMMFGFNIMSISASNLKPAINEQKINLSAKGATAIDANSGQLLYNKNGNRLVPIASVSKIITADIVLEKIDKKQLSWNTKIKISPEIARLSTIPSYTNVPLIQGQYYTVKELYQASLIYSANAAAMALGNYISGNSSDFGKLMGKTVSKVGIKNYKLYNACGLANGLLGQGLENPNINKNTENEMSSMDLAKFSQHVINKYPTILEVTKQPTLNWRGKEYPSNDIMSGGNTGYIIDGLKIGSSDTAGGNFVGTGVKDNHRIITVVLGTPVTQQFNQTRILLNGINKYLTTEKIDNKSSHSVTTINGIKPLSKLNSKNNDIYWVPKTN